LKILVAGCSFALNIDKIIRRKIPGCTVVSVAKAGAGNRYISDSVLLATTKQQFDAVYVSWSGFSRYDVCVDDLSANLFDDWVNSCTLDNRTYVSTGGIGSWDFIEHEFADMLFSGYHKFVDHEQMHLYSLLEIKKVHGYLTAIGKPFYFTCMLNQFRSSPDEMSPHTCEYGVDRYPNNKQLANSINTEQWILDNQDGMYETASRLNMLSDDKFHPSIQGYEYWVDLFVQRLKQDKVV
jgi:hypothetical protein